MATCFAGGEPQVDFTWENYRVELPDSPSFPPGALTKLTLDERTRSLRDLVIDGEALAVGVRYDMRVTGCMKNAASNGMAESSIGLQDMPSGSIAGGNRSVGDTDQLILTACETAGSG